MDSDIILMALEICPRMNASLGEILEFNMKNVVDLSGRATSYGSQLLIAV